MLDRAQRSDAALAVIDRILDLCDEMGARRIGLYAAIDGELDAEPAAIALRRTEMETWYPAVDASELVFRRWNGDDERSAGRYGISEPPLGPGLSVADLDLVIMPLVAFDDAGNRLGFGAGYYDRALGAPSTTDGPTKVGLAYDFQELPRWEPESHDVALDFVLTPTRSLRCRAVRDGSDRDGSGRSGPIS